MTTNDELADRLYNVLLEMRMQPWVSDSARAQINETLKAVRVWHQAVSR